MSITQYIKTIIDGLQTKVQNSNYTKYIQLHKRVVIVGPDPKLLNQKKGYIFDEYPITIRLNTTYNYLPFTDKEAEDFGKNTHVLYQSPSCFKSAIQEGGAELLTRLTNIEFINYQNGNDRKSTYFATPKYCFPEAEEKFKRFLEKHKKQISTRLHYSHVTCKALADLLTYLNPKKKSLVPRTGCLAIWDALIHGATEIRIEGMSFYQGGGHLFRKVEKPLRPQLDHRNNPSPHDSDVEIILLKYLIKIYPNLFHLDQELQQAFF